MHPRQRRDLIMGFGPMVAVAAAITSSLPGLLIAVVAVVLTVAAAVRKDEAARPVTPVRVVAQPSHVKLLPATASASPSTAARAVA